MFNRISYTWGLMRASWDVLKRDKTLLRFLLLSGVCCLLVLFSFAVVRMGGGIPTVGDGFREAVARLPQIAGWALLSATVGLILRIIEDRSEKIGRIVAGLLGLAWTVASFMVVPVLVAERKGP